ncbi:MAG: hypothetical protein HY343_02425 [Lentisphaerae bacterium]|nr:hypothetical protein [Lentisphaerota bacterium]
MTMNAPILVLLHGKAPNRFASYLTEILDAIGVLTRDELDLAAADLTPASLEGRALAILGNVPVTRRQESLLRRFVERGGVLIAMRPPFSMASLFGVVPTPSVVKGGSEGYVTFRSGHPLVRNLPVPSLQFHGTADLYELRGAESLAWLGAQLGVKTSYPAVALHRQGRGRAVLFAFDLAACTVLFHQGYRFQSSVGSNPDPNGDGAFKPDDLFYKSRDERLKMAPQADLYADWLAALIRELLGPKLPVPRLWHFPNAAPAVAFLDGDSDGMTPAAMEKIFRAVERGGGKYTLYVMRNDFKTLAPARRRALCARGHDIGIHPYAGRKPSLAAMDRVLTEDMASFRKRYRYQPVAERGHSVVWVGWTEHAKFLLKQGLRLDTSFFMGAMYQYGYISGTGRPFRFMDEQGRIIDVYEQPSLTIEDGLLTDKCLMPAMDVPGAIRLSRRFIDDAADAYHTVYHPCFHPGYIVMPHPNSTPWIKAVVAHARRRKLPFVNAREWVAFNDARRSVRMRIQPQVRSQGRFTLNVSALYAVRDATILLPANWRGKSLRPGQVKGQCKARLVSIGKQKCVAVILSLKARQPETVTVEYR